MSGTPTPVPTESLAEAGQRIRDAAPIRGDRATDKDCQLRHDLIDETLVARGIVAGAHAWHTAQLSNGHIAGVWAMSNEEAELELTVLWGQSCHWVVTDPQCHLYREYFPHGKDSALTADRRFPLGPPRRIRNQFASAPSLLDGIWNPSPTGAGPTKGSA